MDIVFTIFIFMIWGFDSLWTEVEQLLAENYQAVQSEFKDFKLYKLK